MIRYAPQYLRSAAFVIGQYDGSIPLAAFLKQYFKANPKFGSKDRKHIGHLCYCYFRTARAVQSSSIEEKIKAALFLCEPGPAEWGELVPEEWHAHWSNDYDVRWQHIGQIFPGSSRSELFPWSGELSDDIDAAAFAASHLVQPDLFLRIRPGMKKRVEEKLNAAQMEYRLAGEHALALPNASKIDNILEVDREVVVQDLSSQRIAEVIEPPIDAATGNRTVWDCCAASGGKSLLLHDLDSKLQITVSDVRPSILRNLEERFKRAGINRYQSFVADLTAQFKVPFTHCDIVVCDAPCSGSGTWGRTPEQLYFFSADKIDRYVAMQRSISANVIPYVAAGGYLLYVTCSVFKKENEDMVDHILTHKSLQLLNATLLKGYDVKADTMFAALFKCVR